MKEDPIVSLSDLLLDQLRDLYSVERQLIPALSELESIADSEALRQRLRRHAEETRRQKDRLEKIGRTRGWDLGGDPSKAMEGLIAGGRAHILEVDAPPARDFLIVAHSHRVERYELAAYGATLSLANRLGLEEVVALLEASLAEEQEMDESLARLAEEKLLVRIPSE